MELSIAQLHFIEAEVLCRLFATQYSLPVDDVLRVGLTEVMEKYPQCRDRITPTEDTIRSLNLPSLREEMRSRQLRISGKKCELQTRLVTEVARVKNLLHSSPD
jgi:hypothetical protein